VDRPFKYRNRKPDLDEREKFYRDQNKRYRQKHQLDSDLRKIKARESLRRIEAR
jgi:hypothetical protein